MRTSVALKPGLAAVTLTALIGCGGTGTPTGQPAAPAATPGAVPATPSQEAASPAASPVPKVVLATAEAEPALVEAWHAQGPAVSKACTYSPSIAATGRIWVAVCWGSSFWSVGPDGKQVEAWGSKGTDPGQFDFSYPAAHDSIGAIAFAPDGSFFTIEAGNLRVQHFDADGKFIKAWGSFGKGDGQFAKPTSIAVAPNGQVFVADGARLDIQVFEADGTFVRSMAKGQAGAGVAFAYLAVDKSGNAYVNRHSQVLEYGPDGALELIIDAGKLCSQTSGMAFDTAGDLFVLCRSDQPDATLELGPDFSLLHHWPGTGESVAIDPSGSALYVSDVESPFLRKLELPKS